MPLPKRQHSKTRGRTRRTHWKVATVASDARLPRIAPNLCFLIAYGPFCGFYKGNQIVEIARVKAIIESIVIPGMFFRLRRIRPMAEIVGSYFHN